MAGEIKHAPAIPDATELTQAEWESLTAHVVDSFVEGDILVVNASGVPTRLAAPASGMALMGNGVGVPPSYQSVASPNRSVTVVATTPYTVLPGDDILLVNSGIGAIQLDLPTAIGILGQTYTIKKTSADTNVITIEPFGAQTIDGQANMTIDQQYTSFDIVSDGANWMVF